MKYRKLGNTDIIISAIALGSASFGNAGTWGPQDDADSIATVHAALDAGINFFDTAEQYGNGHAEVVFGRALTGHYHEVVIATKVSPHNLTRDALPVACEQSLRRLNTDVIDLYQIHRANHDIPIHETMEALGRLQEQGKIRAIGVSNFGVLDITDALAVSRCETNQVPYSLLFRATEFAIQPRCVHEGVGVLCYSPLTFGLLTGKFGAADDVPPGRARSPHFSGSRPHARHGQPGCEAKTFATIDSIRQICEDLGQPMARFALAWLLNQAGVTSVITGARRPDQIIENAAAADLALLPSVSDRLTQETEQLKQLLGPAPDLFESPQKSWFR